MKYHFLIALVVVSQQVSGQTLYNNGAVLHIANGGTLSVVGDFTNTSGSTYNNNGRVELKGSLTNNQVMASPASGTLSFSGTTAQSLNGASVYFAKDVEVNNANGVTLNTALKVDGTCSFLNGNVHNSSQSDALIFTSNAIVSGTNSPGDASHVNGFVLKEGTGSFTFPVGDASKYQPVSVNLSANSAGLYAQYVAGDAGSGTFSSGGASSTPLFAYNAREYWDLTPAGSAAGTVTINWDGYQNVGINNVSHLKVAHKSGGAWLNESGTGIGSTTSGSVTSASVNTWSPFTLGSISSGSPLPISTIALKGSAANGLHDLSWTVGGSEAIRDFLVEQSADGTTFRVLATVPYQSANQHYAYAVAQLQSQPAFYRVRTQAAAGRELMSNTVFLSGVLPFSGLVVFPNPARDHVRIQTGGKSGSVAAHLYHANGQLMGTAQLQTPVGYLDVRALSSGTYFLRLDDGRAISFVRE